MFRDTNATNFLVSEGSEPASCNPPYCVDLKVSPPGKVLYPLRTELPSYRELRRYNVQSCQSDNGQYPCQWTDAKFEIVIKFSHKSIVHCVLRLIGRLSL